MAKNDATDILFPEGRLIMGDCYIGSDKDSKGNPRVIKSGPNAGNPTKNYFMGVAIPKGAEQAWYQTTWGQQILAVAAAAHPGMYQNPAFSWKIEDGNSAIPNKSNSRMCDVEGAPGHWILKFSTNIAPGIYSRNEQGALVDVTANVGALKRGYWVQVSGSVRGNTGDTPGIYLNHNMVLFTRPDTVITSGPDANAVFGAAGPAQPLPGVAAVPFAAAPAMPAMGVPAMPAATGTPASMALPAQPTMVAPNPGFLAGPGAPAMPGAVPAALPMAPAMPMAPAAPPVPAGPVLTAAGAATGFTLAQFRASGWTDDQLRANGYIA